MLEFDKELEMMVNTEYTTFLVFKDGTAYGSGQNTNGELGIGNKTNQSTFVKLPLENVKAISVNKMGGYSTIFTLKDGTAYICGSNILSIAEGDPTDITHPRKIKLDKITEVSFIGSDVAFITEDSSLYVCGSNTAALSIPTVAQTPTKVLDNVVKARGGTGHMIVLKKDGTAWVSGGKTEVPYGVAVGGTVNTLTQLTKLNFTGAKDIEAAEFAAYLLLADGTMYGCAYNSRGELGLGDTTQRKTFTLMPKVENIKKMVTFNDGIFIMTNSNAIYFAGSCNGLAYTNITTIKNMVDINATLKDKYVDIVIAQVNLFLIRSDGVVLFKGGDYYGSALGVNAYRDFVELFKVKLLSIIYNLTENIMQRLFAMRKP